MSANKGIVNKLDRATVRKLEDLVYQHKAEISSGKWTRAEFAIFATKQLGRPVTKYNVSGAADVMGITFKEVRRGVGLASTRELKAGLVMLAKAFVELAGQLGAGIPIEVAEIAKLGDNGEDKGHE